MKSHSASSIHQQRVRGEQLPILMFGHAQTSMHMHRQTPHSLCSKPVGLPRLIAPLWHAAADRQQTLQVPTSAIRAEVLWCLNTVANHHSYNSNERIGEFFATMFSDSDIAKSFACGKDKTSYIIRFGIAPHFKKLLINSVNDLGPFVLMFDEAAKKNNNNWIFTFGFGRMTVWSLHTLGPSSVDTQGLKTCCKASK